ncbi:MAG TPA: FG-GAP repeat protein [Thermoanaerobaculia bacterium]|nr:FG-GAP repeat protein [Thermoanaerobaculia bacterium]
MEAELLPIGAEGNQFGGWVALSSDGRVALVTDLDESCHPPFLLQKCGAVYAFARTNGVWTQEAKILPPYFSDFVSAFGVALALSADGSTAVVGRPSDTVCFPEPCRGEVFVYSRNAGTWSLTDVLKSSDTLTRSLGSAVALSQDGNTVLAGAPSTDCPGIGRDCGAAYVFVRGGATWTEQAKLSASTPQRDYFGRAVGLSADGTVALIGAADASTLGGNQLGSVYAFIRGGSSWTESQKIVGGPSRPGFGVSLALSGNGRAALIGALPASCANIAGCDRVHRIEIQGSAWSTPQELLSFAPGDLSRYGLALSSNGSTGLVGAPGTDCPAGMSCGVVHVLGFLPTLEPGIPTASHLGLVLLALLLAASGARLLARRRRSA